MKKCDVINTEFNGICRQYIRWLWVDWDGLPFPTLTHLSWYYSDVCLWYLIYWKTVTEMICLLDMFLEKGHWFSWTNKMIHRQKRASVCTVKKLIALFCSAFYIAWCLLEMEDLFFRPTSNSCTVERQLNFEHQRQTAWCSRDDVVDDE